jgi:hypothetical protein
MEPIEPSRPVECAGAWAKISTISHAYPPLHGIADEIDVKVTEFIKKKEPRDFSLLSLPLLPISSAALMKSAGGHHDPAFKAGNCSFCG